MWRNKRWSRIQKRIKRIKKRIKRIKRRIKRMREWKEWGNEWVSWQKLSPLFLASSKNWISNQFMLAVFSPPSNLNGLSFTCLSLLSSSSSHILQLSPPPRRRRHPLRLHPPWSPRQLFHPLEARQWTSGGEQTWISQAVVWSWPVP